MTYNKVILIGRLVSDPEMRTTASGKNVANFRIAVDRGRQKDRNQERTADFFNVTAWAQSGEFLCRYFSKGKPIGVEGTLQNNDYKDKDGNKRQNVSIKAERLFFVESKGGEKAAADPQDEGWTALDIDGEEDTPF